MVDDLAFVEDQRILERLPNIRKLFLEQGLRFERAFNEIPLSGPARANFFSGQQSLTNGIVVNSSTGFDLNQTIATALDDVGYQTMFLGRFMNDYSGATVPPGFDQAWIADGHDLKAPTFYENGKLKHVEDGYGPDNSVRFILDFMKRHRDEPTFVYYPMSLPHWPMVPTPDSEEWKDHARRTE